MTREQAERPTMLPKTNAEAKRLMTLNKTIKAALGRKTQRAQKTLSDFQKIEDDVAKELAKQGFEDPREHVKLRETTHFMGLDNGQDRPARRFMMEFKFMNVGDLESNQVRGEKADKNWMKNKLIPRIEAHGTLEYPIYIRPSGKIVHGHNRWESWKQILKRDPNALNTVKIPVIVLSDAFFVDEAADQISEMVGSGGAFNNKVSQIIPNKKQENNDYSMESVSVGVRQMFDIDPKMGGLNPSGKPFYDENNPTDTAPKAAFDKIMDRFYEGEFSAAKRTEIRKLVHRDQSVKILHNFDSRTIEITNMGWPSGVKAKNKRHEPEEWSQNDPDPVRNPDGDKKILHRVISTAGVKHKEQVRSIIVDKYQDGTLDEISGFRLLLELESKTRSTVISVNDRAFRNYIANQLTALNIGNKKVNWPGVLEVRCSKEVQDALDIGLIADWDDTKDCFIDRATGKQITPVA